MSYAHAAANPGAYPPSDFHPPITHSQCHCAHPQYSTPAHSATLQCGEAAAMDDIQRLTHRASFAESALYAVLHSNGPKAKGQATEANDIDRLIESVEALTQEFSRLSQDASASTITLSETLDTSIQAITRNPESQALKLEESQDTFKELMGGIRVELQGSRTQLLEEVKSQIRAGVEESSDDDSWALRQMLAERAAQPIQAKEDVRIARIDHSNAESIDEELNALKNELASINEVQTSDTKKARELELESKKASFAIRKMLEGRYTSDEWIEQAPKDLFPFDSNEELLSLGRKMSDVCKEDDLVASLHHTSSKEPMAYQNISADDHNPGTIGLNHAVMEQPPPDLVTRPVSPTWSIKSLKNCDDPWANFYDNNFYDNDISPHPTVSFGNNPVSPKQLAPAYLFTNPIVVEPSPSRPGDAWRTQVLSMGLTMIAIQSAQPPKKLMKDPKSPRIRFKKGELITHVETGPGLWLGTNATGQRGWFEQKKVELM